MRRRWHSCRLGVELELTHSILKWSHEPCVAQHGGATYTLPAQVIEHDHVSIVLTSPAHIWR
jgi:hypothetical protein